MNSGWLLQTKNISVRVELSEPRIQNNEILDYLMTKILKVYSTF